VKAVLGQHVIPSWSPLKIARSKRKVSAGPPSAADPPGYVSRPLFEISATEPDPVLGKEITNGRMFNALDVSIDIVSQQSPAVTQEEAITRWGDCVILIEAIVGTVSIPVYRRQISSMQTDRATLGPSLEGLIAQLRGRPAQTYRGTILIRDRDDDAPYAYVTAVAWGDGAQTLSGDQAGRPVEDQWHRPDQGWSFFRFNAGADTNPLQLRDSDGNVNASGVNPNGGRLGITALSIQNNAASGTAVDLSLVDQTTTVTTRWRSDFPSGQMTALVFPSPIMTRVGASLRVLIGGTTALNTTSFQLQGFYE